VTTEPPVRGDSLDEALVGIAGSQEPPRRELGEGGLRGLGERRLVPTRWETPLYEDLGSAPAGIRTGLALPRPDFSSAFLAACSHAQLACADAER
jgi:hypothetical protein